jgi:Flp pilus assembly protein TadG
VQANNRKRERKYEQGQLLIMLAVVMIGLMLTSSLAIDVAFGYVTKARLQKAVDAACLVAMQNLALSGQAGAQTIATNTFTANYPTTGLDTAAPTLSVTFNTNSGQQVVGVSATANIHTIFFGLLPGKTSYSVVASAQAMRGYLAMTVIVDRSGSMSTNGGQQAIVSAVPMFVKFFNNSTDEVALTSFASAASTDFAISTSFQTPITNAINSMSFTGGTFGLGGLTLAKAQEDSVIPTQGENLVKVVVYFTDGMVNEIQDTLPCNNGTLHSTLYNYGGYDSGSSYDFFNPADGTDWSTQYSQQGWGLDNNGYPPHDSTHDCKPVTKFTSQQTGNLTNFSRTAITSDAQYRSLQVATAMRNEGIYVYSIGLGSAPSQTFLQEIANDPASPTYDSTQPVGEAIMAPDCSTPNSQKCNTELQQVFQTIAARILLRLTQ